VEESATALDRRVSIYFHVSYIVLSCLLVIEYEGAALWDCGTVVSVGFVLICLLEHDDAALECCVFVFKHVDA
jgi:hypothetical protein